MLCRGGLLSTAWTTAVFILFCAVDLNEFTIIVHPDNQCATFGETIQFNCSTSERSGDAIIWKHRRSVDLDEQLEFVYSEGNIMPYYRGTMRYRVNVLNETGAYNLIINNVTSNDTGEFRCIEKGSETEYKIALLIVKGLVACKSEENPFGQDSNRSARESPILAQVSNKCAEEKEIRGITIAILVINSSALVSFIVFLCFHFRRCNRKQTKGQQKKELATPEEDKMQPDEGLLNKTEEDKL